MMENETIEMNNDERQQDMYLHLECKICDLPLQHLVGTRTGGALMQCGNCKVVIDVGFVLQQRRTEEE